MTTTQEILTQALLKAEFGTQGVQPSILMNLNINPEMITGIAQHIVGEIGSAAYDNIRAMCDEGWVMFRVQTEFCSLRGHITMAYFAKLKSN